MTYFPKADIKQALNGKIALDMVMENDAEAQPFEVVFMDINMPEMDGFESHRRIMQNYLEGKLSVQPYVAAITAYTSENQR